LKVQTKADLALILVTMFWGASCVLTKIGLSGLEPLTMIAIRFLLAFVLSAAIFWKRIAASGLTTIKYSAILAGILFVVYIFMTYGVKYTSASNAGFLTCLASVFIPIFAFVFLRQKQEKKVIFSICLATLGVALLSFNAALKFNIGDVFSILCSVAFAVHILVMGTYTKRVDSLALGVLQLGFAGIYSLAAAFIFETPELPQTTQSWVIVLILSIFCTAVGFIVQSVAQKYTTPSHTGLIFTMEPAFAAIFAFMFLGEVLAVRGYIGEVLMIISILIVEVELPRPKKMQAVTEQAKGNEIL
jgi:drug/metabolite transporter (DMT)-like permease